MSSTTAPTRDRTAGPVRHDHASWRRPERCAPTPTGPAPEPWAPWPGDRDAYPDVHDAPTIEVPVVVADLAPSATERWLSRSAALASATRAVSLDARSIARAGTAATIAAAGAVVLGGGRVLLRLAETALRTLHRLVPLVVTAAVLAGAMHLVPWERIRPVAADAARWITHLIHPRSAIADGPAATSEPAPSVSMTSEPAPTTPQAATPPTVTSPWASGSSATDLSNGALRSNGAGLPYGVSPLTPEVATRVQPGMTLAEITRTIGISADYAGYLPGQLKMLPAALRSDRDDPTSTATWAVRNWTADAFQPCQLLVTFRDDRAVHIVRSGGSACPPGDAA